MAQWPEARTFWSMDVGEIFTNHDVPRKNNWTCIMIDIYILLSMKKQSWMFWHENLPWKTNLLKIICTNDMKWHELILNDSKKKRWKFRETSATKWPNGIPQRFRSSAWRFHSFTKMMNDRNDEFTKWSQYPLVNVYKKQWKDPPFLMGKSTISMAIFNCYVSLPEGNHHSFHNNNWLVVQ